MNKKPMTEIQRQEIIDRLLAMGWKVPKEKLNSMTDSALSLLLLFAGAIGKALGQSVANID